MKYLLPKLNYKNWYRKNYLILDKICKYYCGNYFKYAVTKQK